MNLFEILKEALYYAPFLKYAMPILGIGAILAIIKSFKIDDARVPKYSILFFTFLMFVFFFFAVLVNISYDELKYPVLIFLYFWLTVVSFCVVMVISGFFFNYPKSTKEMVDAFEMILKKLFPKRYGGKKKKRRK